MCGGGGAAWQRFGKSQPCAGFTCIILFSPRNDPTQQILLTLFPSQSSEIEAQRGYVTCLRSHSWPKKNLLSSPIPAPTLHSHLPVLESPPLSLLGKRERGLHSRKVSTPPEISRFEPGFPGKQEAPGNSTFIHVLSEAFLPPSQRALRSPNCS